ncbi:hypothetical protein DM01DRAFT_1334128 [Hesseltinella vesiculosa]|uniref:Uncharacterized protein n=1 Tax=Hesseltinella vesiculosa TaxID=101127 RepID=A0A1X2GMP5_9FUNG|nr:hypothetical protein DM01DRAFT_1334128 [Hesseltinella vesiculosa]
MTDYALAPVIRLPRSKAEMDSDALETMVTDTLFLKSFPASIQEQDLYDLLHVYEPIEIELFRQSGEGYVRFGSNAVADQVYALYQDFEFHNGSRLYFAIDQDNTIEAQGSLLQIHHLPHYVENSMVYQLFRPFGPLALCKLLLEPDDSSFHGAALVQYFYQQDTMAAMEEMDGQVVDGVSISVESVMVHDYYQKPSSMAMPEKSNEMMYVDLLNLYIKNLDPKVTNNDLFAAFRSFGRIVSARVMSNTSTGQSKGYGFVSYSRPDEAKLAMDQMNGKLLLSKPLIVSYHTPKKPRQPTANGTAMPQQTSPVLAPQQPRSQPLLSPTSPTPPSHQPAVNGLGIDNVDQIAMDIKDLSIGQKYPTVPSYPLQRKNSNAEHQTNSHKMLLQSTARLSPPFSSPISGSTTAGHSLASLTSGISIQQPPPNMASGNGHRSNDYKQTADGRPTLRRRTSLESVSTVMTESTANLQRQKMTQAVMNCLNDPLVVPDVVDMLLTLKKKERSLCLFNQDFLKSKIELALEALEIFQTGEEDDEEEQELQRMLPRRTVKKPSAPAGPVGPDSLPKMLPKRVSHAIPIVPPPSATKTSPTNGLKATLTPEQKVIVQQVTESMQGKASHEQKQLLGDRLFPMVKATGTKQAAKVTIRLLDTVELTKLTDIMFDKVELKRHAEKAFAGLTKQ